jgi:EAL domain-containing protein (putative c-di-GMP-specific phosphodiesterase class I)
MEQLKAMGSSFALDDFGAGLSSFAYLKQFPVKYLKIDGAFVRNMANDNTDKAMVNAISNIGKTLGKVIVAEFVEDEQALTYLKEMGVEFAQGYYLHKPERLDGLVNNTP